MNWNRLGQLRLRHNALHTNVKRKNVPYFMDIEKGFGTSKIVSDLSRHRKRICTNSPLQRAANVN